MDPSESFLRNSNSHTSESDGLENYFPQLSLQESTTNISVSYSSVASISSSVYPSTYSSGLPQRRYQENFSSYRSPLQQRTQQFNVANSFASRQFPSFPIVRNSIRNQIPPAATYPSMVINPCFGIPPRTTWSNPYIGVPYTSGVIARPNLTLRSSIPSFVQNRIYMPNTSYPQANECFSTNASTNFFNIAITPVISYDQVDPHYSMQFYHTTNGSSSQRSLYLPYADTLHCSKDVGMTETDHITEIKEDHERIVIRLSVRNFAFEQLAVKVSDGTLFVQGSYEDKPDECAYGTVSRTFMRKIQIPSNIREEETLTSFMNGVLAITLVKGPPFLTKKEAVPVKGNVSTASSSPSPDFD